MQASILCLLLLPVALQAVPCTDSTPIPSGDPITASPTTPAPTTPAPTTPAPTTPAPTTPAPTTEYVPPPRAFPQGTYGLPRPNAGCPFSSGFKTFYRYWDTEDYRNGNAWPRTTEHFLGYMKTDGYKMFFCVKPDASKGLNYDWPAGDYCIIKKGDCPAGFAEGSITWDDEDDSNTNANTKNKNYHPDGAFDEDTQMDFCCRNDGSAATPIKLPIRRAFYLMRYTGEECQRVAEMTATEEVVLWDDEDTGNSNSQSGAHPMNSGNAANHRLHFCYYEPEAPPA